MAEQIGLARVELKNIEAGTHIEKGGVLGDVTLQENEWVKVEVPDGDTHYFPKREVEMIIERPK